MKNVDHPVVKHFARGRNSVLGRLDRLLLYLIGFDRLARLNLLDLLQKRLSSTFPSSCCFSLATAARRRLLLLIVLEQCLERFYSLVLLAEPLMAETFESQECGIDGDLGSLLGKNQELV